MGENPESSSEYYEDDEEDEEGGAKPEKKEKVEFVFGGKKVAELQKRAEELELANQQLQASLDTAKANSKDEINNLNN